MSEEKSKPENEEEDGSNFVNLPEGWIARESKSRPGMLYYVNQITQQTQWEVPKEPAKSSKKHTHNVKKPHPYEKPASKDEEEIKVCHILIKHSGSRNPYSWRDRTTKITKSKEEAVEELKLIREDLLKNSNDGKDLKKLIKDFKNVAYEVSDCSSAKDSGEMQPFGRGVMQRAFEDAAFAMEVNQVSEIVSTDSGVHIILRLE